LRYIPGARFNDSIIVKTKRLDTWYREEGIESVDFIWADVQGAEENLIKGGQEALNRMIATYDTRSISKSRKGDGAATI
jgi:hypothetical protein